MQTSHSARGKAAPGDETESGDLPEEGKAAFVVCGFTGSGIHRMDEASTLGKTLCAELNSDGSISYMSFYPEDLGISRGDPALQEAICQAVAKKLKDLRMVELQLREVDYYRSYGDNISSA